MIQFMSRFLYILKGKKKVLLLMLLLFLFSSFLELLGVGMVGPFIALITEPSSITKNPFLNQIYIQLHFSSVEQFSLVLGLIVVIVFYVKSFTGFKVQHYIFRFGFSQQGELATKLMQAYLYAPYAFHLNKNSATLIQNISGETLRFCNYVMMPLLTMVSNLFVCVALVSLLMITDFTGTLFVAVTMLFAFLIYQRFKKRLAHLGRESTEASTEIIRTINHGLGGLKETRVIGCEGFFVEEIREQAKRYAHAASTHISIGNIPRYVLEAFLISFLVGFTILFMLRGQQDSRNISAVLGIFALSSVRLLPALTSVLGAVIGIKYASFSMDQLYFDLKELEDNEIESHVLKKQSFTSSLDTSKNSKSFETITLDNMRYRYPEAESDALSNLSMSITRGEMIGIVGKSGAGKTTLVDVLLGLLKPQSGDIRVDNRSIYSDLRKWQKIVGYVPQTIFLIDDTLKKNIAFGVSESDIDHEKLESAIKLAQLTELVSDLPEGIHTVLGERGVRLSGGQRQRIGIARAIYHEREVLILDEATSALDNETEQLVSEAIRSLGMKKTIIIIAHRLSTIKYCNRVYKLEKGKVIKSGSYEEVIYKG